MKVIYQHCLLHLIKPLQNPRKGLKGFEAGSSGGSFGPDAEPEKGIERHG